MTDILLLRLIKEDDEKAFKVLFDHYFTPVCRYMHLYIQEKQEVEELAMDLFWHIWLHRKDLEIRVSFKAYIFQSARNKCLNFIRNKRSVLSIEGLDVEEKSADDVCLILETNELSQLIEEAILSLPEKCKTVFLNSREELLSNQEIAEKMNISVKTVEAQITKALKRIRKILGEKYYYLF